ncbi:hypothetical protein B0H10DRAFT_1940553 [Mycena sp. CBHHK59/15]|nr:hypothetical protein B0H10DRAFT_1940553 [Mycena sp. CBHHK59/15]
MHRSYAVTVWRPALPCCVFLFDSLLQIHLVRHGANLEASARGGATLFAELRARPKFFLFAASNLDSSNTHKLPLTIRLSLVDRRFIEQNETRTSVAELLAQEVLPSSLPCTSGPPRVVITPRCFRMLNLSGIPRPRRLRSVPALNILFINSGAVCQRKLRVRWRSDMLHGPIMAHTHAARLSARDGPSGDAVVVTPRVTDDADETSTGDVVPVRSTCVISPRRNQSRWRMQSPCNAGCRPADRTIFGCQSDHFGSETSSERREIQVLGTVFLPPESFTGSKTPAPVISLFKAGEFIRILNSYTSRLLDATLTGLSVHMTVLAAPLSSKLFNVKERRFPADNISSRIPIN